MSKLALLRRFYLKVGRSRASADEPHTFLNTMESLRELRLKGYPFFRQGEQSVLFVPDHVERLHLTRMRLTADDLFHITRKSFFLQSLRLENVSGVALDRVHFQKLPQLRQLALCNSDGGDFPDVIGRLPACLTSLEILNVDVPDELKSEFPQSMHAPSSAIAVGTPAGLADLKPRGFCFVLMAVLPVF